MIVRLKQFPNVASLHSSQSRRLLPAYQRLCPRPVGDEKLACMGSNSEPEPDLSIARGSIDDYAERNPDPSEVAFVAEVSDTSLAGDRGQMARIYGGSGIPVCWIVNLVDRQVEVYSNPIHGACPSPSIFRDAQTLTLAIGDRQIGPIAVADLLPKGVRASRGLPVPRGSVRRAGLRLTRIEGQHTFFPGVTYGVRGIRYRTYV
ncbi:MAG: Uma2 family endonuclease [Isosphaeraceae bacterium]